MFMEFIKPIEEIEILVKKLFQDCLFDETYMDADYCKQCFRTALLNADKETWLYIKSKYMSV